MLHISAGLAIPEKELQETFIRAAGPGGQHVNKTSTAVQLRFNAQASAALSDPVRQRLLALAGNRATARGEIVIEASRFRSRELNRNDARHRLKLLVREACKKPLIRKPTRPTRTAKEKRLTQKRLQALKKSARRKPDPD
ncbi:aminoacyl-tRNA hydrolase [bacterium]|nr:aminoacyl-tRNA hydrolase [bacterium]